MTVTSAFLKNFCLINNRSLFVFADYIWFFSFSAAVCVQQYDEQFVHLFNLTMTQLKQVWINDKIDKNCNKFKLEFL